MQVKITSCAIPTYWYHDRKGETFEVSEAKLLADSYRVIDSPELNAYYIQKLDCEIVKNDDDAKTRMVVTYYDTPSQTVEAVEEEYRAERKATPVYSGVLNYFPDAIRAVAQASYAGQQQHNPDLPLAWDRSKSGDELDALTRHLLEVGTVDSDGVRHSTKVAWRALANLQKEIEKHKENGLH